MPLNTAEEGVEKLNFSLQTWNFKIKYKCHYLLAKLLTIINFQRKQNKTGPF